MKNDTIIVDDYVSKELAILLSETGFENISEYVPFPTLNIARKYIREKHKIEFNVRCVAVGSLPDRLDGNIAYVVDIADLEFKTWIKNNIMEDSYKDALVKAMVFILNKIKNK